MRAAVVVLALLAVPAFADEAADRKLAEKHFRIGERAYKAQSFATAAQHFEQAYQVMPLPEIAFSAAQAYRRAYRVEPSLPFARRSVELYRIYLDKVKRGGRVGDAADSLGEMQREVDKLMAAGAKAAAAAKAERTTIVINPELATEMEPGGLRPTGGIETRRDATMREIADLPGANEVKIVATLDGKIVPAYEMIDVEPGPHTIRVEAEGYLPKETTERAVKGVAAIADVMMAPKPARVTVTTDAGARIRVDGRPVTLAKDASLELAAGRHVITIAHAGRETIARELTVVRGQQLAMRERLDKTTRRKAVPWIAVVAGGLAAFSGASVVGALIEDSRASDKLASIRRGDQTEAVAADYRTMVDRRGQLTTAAWVAGGAALVVGAAAVGLYVFDSPSDDGVRVTPAVTSGGGGLSIGGRF